MKNPPQVNYTIRNAGRLKALLPVIAKAVADANTVCIIRDGYAASQYAMLNAVRCDPAKGYYLCNFENYGLPDNWSKLLRTLL